MHIIIPARYDSTRLPGKPLLDVGGKPLLERVYDCARATGAKSITVATDDERIRKAAEGFGADVCMTAVAHSSGTDRLGEAVQMLGLGPQEIVVNLQGDEPLLPPALVRRVADTLAQHADAVVATACHPIEDAETFNNPNAVKVVCNQDGYALYFSRAAIPWPRAFMSSGGDGTFHALRHIGLYAYRAGFIARFRAWGPCPMEEAEQLEQLRVLWHGERIVVCVTEEAPPNGVDTPEDLERARVHFRRHG
jgi:3-deoxy-manno-octulosonate cytidylyltransferase (CMP-KDO synthetase)